MADLVQLIQQNIEASLADLVKVVGVNFVQLLLNVGAAIVVIVVGWVVALLVSKVVEKLLRFIKLEEFLAEHKLEDALGKVRLSKLLVQLTKYYILLVFFQSAISILQLAALTAFISNVLGFSIVLIGALLIVVAAALLGELIKEKILEVEKGWKFVVQVANAAKLLTVFMGIVVGLDTMGYDTTIINQTFVTIVQALSFGVALAFGIAFGLGAQDEAKGILKGAKGKLGL